MIAARVSGLQEAIRILQTGNARVQRAMRNGIYETAVKAKDDVKSKLPTKIDRPTRYTLNALKAERMANGGATVRFKDSGQVKGGHDHYLAPMTYGGIRPQILFERALINAGAMPRGYIAIPSRYVPKDAYGNMTRAGRAQVARWLQANWGRQSTSSSRRGTRERARDQFFIIKPGQGSHLQAGLWYRLQPRVLRPILLFIPRDDARYKRILDFFGMTKEAVDRRFNEVINEHLRREFP